QVDIYVSTMEVAHVTPLHAPLPWRFSMPNEDASIRQDDLIENSVQRQVMPVEETVATEQEVGAAFDTEVEHDLTIWSREYLEPYLDSNDQGRISLNEAGLKDLLAASFDRNAQLVRSLRESLDKTTVGTMKERRQGSRDSRDPKSLDGSGSFETAQAEVNSL